MKDIGNSSNFTEEEELFLLRNKQGKIVGIKDLKQANFQETMKDWKKHLSNPGKHSLVEEKRLIVFPVSRNYTIKEINPAYTMLGYSTIPANRG